MVTGASGLIGGRLAERLHEAGACVLAVSRRVEPVEPCAATYRRSFGEPLGAALQERQIDTLIHCAHDVSGSDGTRASEAGTLQWAAEAAAAGVPRQIFISDIWRLG
jgi:uncharacterized protein YbjT (DUF2867 family)